MKFIIPEFSWSPYGLIVIASVAVGFTVAIFLMRRSGVAKETVLYTCLLTTVCTLTVSVMTTVLQSKGTLNIGFSGLGAAVGMISGVFISNLIMRDKSDIVMASFVATAPLMYGLAKTGCLLAGCCHGKPYDGPFAICYQGTHGGSYFPAQIIDMISFILLFIMGVMLITKMKNKSLAVFIILIVLTPVRFLLEYLRFYHDGSVISQGQVTVLIAGALSLTLAAVWKGVMRIGKQHEHPAAGAGGSGQP